MAGVMRFPAGDSAVLVEVGETDFGMDRVAGVDGVVDAGRRLESALTTIEPTARALSDALKHLAPDAHEIEFGIKLNAELGAIVAKSSVEGHFVVRMSWTRRDTSVAPKT